MSEEAACFCWFYSLFCFSLRFLGMALPPRLPALRALRSRRKNPPEENFYGHEITDSYRWLEDAKSPETRKWVSEELAYTRSILDPLPGRSELHSRLEKLLSIGTISAPQIGGKYYFYYQARRHSESAGAAGPRRFGRERSPAGRCECAGTRWNHRPRLVGAIGRREIRRLRNLAQRF